MYASDKVKGTFPSQFQGTNNAIENTCLIIEVVLIQFQHATTERVELEKTGMVINDIEGAGW